MSWREQAYFGDTYLRKLTVGHTAQGNPAEHDGVIQGAGKSSAYYLMPGAGKSALSYYVESASVVDSNRCAYLRLKLSGAAGGGEAIRAFCTIAAAAAVGRGAHISLNYSGTSSISGESQAIKGTYHVPNSTVSLGTSAVIEAELYADGASSDMTGGMALFGAKVSGNTSGAGTIDAKTYLLRLSGVTDGAAEMVRRAQNEPTWTSKTCLIKCLINGNVTYLVGVEL